MTTTFSGTLGGPGVAVAVAVVLVPVAPVPTATTENVYAVPLVSPVTVQVSRTAVQLWPPGLAVTV